MVLPMSPYLQIPLPLSAPVMQVKKWRALLWNGQKQLFLGHFSSDTDAARAYDKALIDLKGTEAKTNFPASGICLAISCALISQSVLRDLDS